MNDCANTAALNKMLDSQERQEKALESFTKMWDKSLEEIRVAIVVIKESAKDYQGYDMTEDLEDMIKEII